MKPSKCPAKEKNGARKAEEQKKRESEKKNSRLLSAHTRITSLPKILHLDRKGVNGFVVKF